MQHQQHAAASGSYAQTATHQTSPYGAYAAAATTTPNAWAADPSGTGAGSYSTGYVPPPPPGNEETKSIWLGDLQYWMDETYVWNCFAHTGEVVSVKIIRNKTTGVPEGYGFLECTSHHAAHRIIQNFNGTVMPSTENIVFRMNWATFGAGEKKNNPEPDHSIFVGDLGLEVSDQMLYDVFRINYPSIRGAKVVIDALSGRSKGYGFVRFGSEEERDKALVEMNGQYCSSRPMRISIAVPKKQLLAHQQALGFSGGSGYGSAAGRQTQTLDDDANNTTVFVGGLDVSVTEAQLKDLFNQYGETLYVKIPFGKGCGFVQFQHRAAAEEAIRRLHGSVIGSQTVRLSWGRQPANKTAHHNPSSYSPSLSPSLPPPYSSLPAAPSPATNSYYAGNYYDSSQYYSQYPSSYGDTSNQYYSYGQAGGAYYAQSYVPVTAPPMQVSTNPIAPRVTNPTIGITPASTETNQSATSVLHLDPPYDPSNPPDVDRLNASFMRKQEALCFLPSHQHLLLKTMDASVAT